MNITNKTKQMIDTVQVNAMAELEEAVRSQIEKILNDQDLIEQHGYALKNAKSDENQPLKRYAHVKKLVCKKTQKRIYVGYKPISTTQRYYISIWITFSGNESVLRGHLAFLKCLFGQPMYDQIFLQGIYSRIDLAIDFSGPSFDRILILKKGATYSRALPYDSDAKTSKYSGSMGGSYLKLYDNTARKKTIKRKYPYRLEHTLRSNYKALKFHNLHSMRINLSDVSIYDMDRIRPDILGDLFIHNCLRDGLSMAISLRCKSLEIPKLNRQKIIRTIEPARINLYRSESHSVARSQQAIDMLIRVITEVSED